MGRPTGAAPARRSSQDRMLAVTSRPPFEMILRPALPRHGPHYECGALLTSATEESEMVLPRGLAPRSSAFAERRASLTLRELKMVRHAGAAPAPAVWKTAVLAVTPMTRKKVVAASGIAPDSPRLQRGADLSQLHSQWSLRAVSRRGLPLRRLCSLRSALIGMRFRAALLAYRARALLLSYGGMEEWSPDVVMLHGLPGVGRLLSF